ncbi:hypothetical protein DV515_00010931 [Chloebia gouldiae]|uniref:Kindlin-2 N-terminal domain-containing protein n=1 Tax=Chloebia gouldiae TaxID=44316 RepID=A0A3L8S8V2_CHLGU|nr:hypothetical protein DV515_00010931 [Chloebia gouldiae]
MRMEGTSPSPSLNGDTGYYAKEPGLMALDGIRMPDGCYADGTWELSVHVTDLGRDVTLRVTGEIHIGGVMLRLVEKLGECPGTCRPARHPPSAQHPARCCAPAPSSTPGAVFQLPAPCPVLCFNSQHCPVSCPAPSTLLYDCVPAPSTLPSAVL